MMRSAPERRHEPRRPRGPPSAIGSPALLTGFLLTTAARELVSRFVEAEQQPALPVLLDVLELEAQERHERRITPLAARLEAAAGQDLRDARRRPLAAGARAPAARARRGRLPGGRDQCLGLRPARRRQEPRDVRRRPRPGRPRPRRALHADLQPRAGAARREAESRAAARAPQTGSLRGAAARRRRATSSRVPRRPRFSSRSSPNAMSAARCASPAI